MPSRRRFLAGTSALALAPLAASCGRSRSGLDVRLLQDSLPPQVLAAFRQQHGNDTALNVTPEPQLRTIWERLQAWQAQADSAGQQAGIGALWPFGGGTNAVADLATLGDYWLQPAIQQGTIRAFEAAELQDWAQLPARWHAPLRRDAQGQPDEGGAIWGAPYRWGATAIAYHRDRLDALGWRPQDWADLWRPELRDRVSVLDSARETIGLTLKALGASYNTGDLSQVPQLEGKLQALHRQVKFYSSSHYLQPLILGDTWAAVGWSHDLLALRRRYPQIEAVFPQSGTALWLDLWVKPAAKESLSQEARSRLGNWIGFCWQLQTARQISQLGNAASPLLPAMAAERLPSEVAQEPLLHPPQPLLDRSEFLLPLPAPARQQYQALWRRIRQSAR